MLDHGRRHLLDEEDPGEVEADVGGEEEDGVEGEQDVPEPAKEGRKGSKHILQDNSKTLEHKFGLA